MRAGLLLCLLAVLCCSCSGFGACGDEEVMCGGSCVGEWLPAVDHCGQGDACHACPTQAPPNSEAACKNEGTGECGFECIPGPYVHFTDCNGKPADGCGSD